MRHGETCPCCRGYKWDPAVGHKHNHKAGCALAAQLAPAADTASTGGENGN